MLVRQKIMIFSPIERFSYYYPWNHIFVDVSHLVVGEVERLQRRVAEGAVLDGRHVVQVQLQSLQQIVLVEVTNSDLLDFVPEINSIKLSFCS